MRRSTGLAFVVLCAAPVAWAQTKPIVAPARQFGVASFTCGRLLANQSVAEAELARLGWAAAQRSSSIWSYRHPRYAVTLVLSSINGQAQCVADGYVNVALPFSVIREDMTKFFRAEYGDALRVFPQATANGQAFVVGDVLHVLSLAPSSGELNSVRVTSMRLPEMNRAPSGVPR